jgi:hypothetical protein
VDAEEGTLPALRLLVHCQAHLPKRAQAVVPPCRVLWVSNRFHDSQALEAADWGFCLLGYLWRMEAAKERHQYLFRVRAALWKN